MKKKSLFILLFVMCIGFIPKNTFALQVYNNVNIDYRFFVDEDESDAGNLKFKLYDKSGALSFESEYYANNKQYIFGIDETSFVKRFADGTGNFCGYYWDLLDNANSEPLFREYIPYRDILYNIKYVNNVDNVSDFLSSNKLNGSVWIKNYTWNYYTYIPMILEESNSGMKKIVFASVSVRNEHYDNDGSLQTSFTQLYLVNNTNVHRQEATMLNESFLDNMEFMRKTMLDYSDELWEELNNGPIASSEIYSDNKASTNYKYINQSTIDGTRNVPEETLEDYASSLPVLSFKKVDSTDEDKDNNTKNNIINVITNPKTWNNGIVILVISMIVVLGSSFVLIRKRKM